MQISTECDIAYLDNTRAPDSLTAPEALSSPIDPNLPTATLLTVDPSDMWTAKRVSRRISHHGHVK